MRFHEEQRFSGGILAVVAAAIIVAAAVPIAGGLARAEVRGDMVVGVVIALAVGLWLASVRLVTDVSDDAVDVRFIGIPARRRILFGRIARHYPTRYRPLGDYGGWGIRLGWRGRGMAFNAHGDRGVQLELSDGSRFLIGSQRPEELDRAIAKLGG